MGGLGFYGYKNATPLGSNDGLRSQIEITPQNYELGEIEYGDVVKRIFIVKNLGEVNLEVNRISTSCGCTTAKIGNEQIAPDSETELEVTYDTGAMSGDHAKGDQERIIYLRSNDPITPHVKVTLNAYVR